MPPAYPPGAFSFNIDSEPQFPLERHMSHPIVFLLDVDNTLLDNDRFRRDLDARLLQAFGETERGRYWKLFEELRKQLSYADYLGALQQLRFGLDDSPELLQMSSFLLDYPFDQRIYPRALGATGGDTDPDRVDVTTGPPAAPPAK